MLIDTNNESLSKNPVYSEAAEEVGTLVHYAPIVREWRRQSNIALSHSLYRTGQHRMHGLKDLPYAYLTLAELHDYFNPFKPIITSELQKLQRKDHRIGVSPSFCKMCLQEIRNDLMQRGLLPDAGIQLSRQVEDFKEPVEEANKKGLIEPVSKLAKSAVRRQSKSRKKTPPQLLKETRERQAALELTKNLNITAEKLGKILGCNKSTVTRLKAWQNKKVLDYDKPPNGSKRASDKAGPDIEAIDKSQ